MKNLLALFQRRHRSDSEALSAYVDGGLAAAEAAQLEAHVAACETCTRELDELRRVSSMLASMGQAPLPRSFRLRQADVEAAAPAAGGGFGARARTYAPAMAMAAVVLFGAVVVFDVGTRNDESGSFATANRGATEGLSMADSAGPPAAESDNQYRNSGGADASDDDDTTTAPLPEAAAGTAATSEAAAPQADAGAVLEGDGESASQPAPVAPDASEDSAPADDSAQALRSTGDDDSDVRPAFLVAEIVLAAAAVGAAAWFIYTRVGKRGVGS